MYLASILLNYSNITGPGNVTMVETPVTLLLVNWISGCQVYVPVQMTIQVSIQELCFC